jgi:6-phosphogluconolactonase
MTSPLLRVLSDDGTLSRTVAAAVAETITHAVVQRGRCAVALSGGSTPRALYRVLAADYKTSIPWPKVHIFWGDERFVPQTHPDSNCGMARRELLDHVPCPQANVHPMPTDLPSPAAAADAYAATLTAYLGAEPPRFDLILLGIGEDCHTASLFPRSPALAERHRFVAATEAPGDGRARITLTLPVLTAADTVFVLATGARKTDVVARALAPDTNPTDCPAAALRHASGRVVWWVTNR